MLRTTLTATLLVLPACAHHPASDMPRVKSVTVHQAARFDRSPPLAEMSSSAARLDTPECGRPTCGTAPDPDDDTHDDNNAIPVAPPVVAAAANVEQRAPGSRAALPVLTSFDGLGAGFTGPQGTRRLTNPSDNTLAVGPDHIAQIVNGGMAVFTRKGALFDTTGNVLYGPNRSNAIFTGFGGPCETRNSGDAVVRYDQLAHRWLYVLPVFQRGDTPPIPVTRESEPGQPRQPGLAGPEKLINAPAPPPVPPRAPNTGRGRGRNPGVPPLEHAPPPQSPYSMCYAVSVTSDPLGPYYRYQFLRPLFPDYPRPAIWPDGYYVPSSTSDNFIQKHACVVDRNRMLQGLPATEQCIVIDGVNFLNNADIDGQALPPPGAPNIVMAAGGEQLHQRFGDDAIYAWQFHVDWNDPGKTGLRGPIRIPVAPYHYLCNGQLTNCVPQPGTTRRLDAQGDKLMQRLVYRNVDGHESIVAVHSVNTSTGGGGVRWYEFRLDANRTPVLYQQGTYAPDSLYRWLPSAAMDRRGNIGIGYSFGGAATVPGQRFAGRLADDPRGQLTFHESILAPGEASQDNQMRWEDYTTTAMDPRDDCTMWYVGDYLKRGETNYSTRIGAFRFPGCRQGTIAGSAFFDVNHDGVRDGKEPGLPHVDVHYTGAQSGTRTTDANGNFSVTLPADSVYASVDYTVAAAPVDRRGWTSTVPTHGLPDGVTHSAAGFRVHLSHDDNVTAVAFGRVCTVPVRGARDAAFWVSNAGAAMMATLDSNWTRLFDSIDVVDASGARLRTARGRAGYDSLRAWLPGAMRGTPVQRESAALVVAGFNVVSETIDGNATIEDPVDHDWPQVRGLLGRASVALATGDAGVPQYIALVRALNANTATITPVSPATCARR
jgi:hypothetical protein